MPRKMPELPKMRMPDEGYETDAEVCAAGEHGLDRLDFLRRKGRNRLSTAYSLKDEINRKDAMETGYAYLDYANILGRLTALSEAGAGDQNHQLHNDYMGALAECRQSRRELKKYGRWGNLFSDDGFTYSPEQRKFLNAPEVSAQGSGSSASLAERKGN
jgi:hypothetical protein